MHLHMLCTYYSVGHLCVVIVMRIHVDGLYREIYTGTLDQDLCAP